MTDLTKQWKKGELDRNKIYYYETPFNTTDTASGYWLCNYLDTEKDKVKVLGEVPNYDEWKFAQEQLHKEGTWYTERAYKNVRKAVRKLAQNLLQVKPELREWLEVNYGEYL